ncbi:hypothetical protein CSHISOI_06698 [Colletotrichum shisoi]|uniref:Uncharacterized protein n=1 Tax=Colletotrichum shisoi TaxID=2078593 RepID=A0A5Q4BP53_9PEZI|nr:hypothetical protein CSHISOI_06698 [Colletotrichum shisoi]
MSSKDRDVWCDRRTWVRPSPFEHAVPYCPNGLKLVELDYNVVRCVACHFGPPRTTREVDTHRHQDHRRQQRRQQQAQRQSRSQSQGQYEEPPRTGDDSEPDGETPGVLGAIARYVSGFLGEYAPSFFGRGPMHPDDPSRSRSR